MRYINLRFTYLLTYIRTHCRKFLATPLHRTLFISNFQGKPGLPPWWWVLKSFYGRDALPLMQPTVSKHWRI